MGKKKLMISHTVQPPLHNNGHSLDDSARIDSVTFFLVLLILTVAAGFVAAPVILPLILAAITAGLADPLKIRIDWLFNRHRRLSAAVTLVIMIVAVLTPLFIVGFFTVSTLVNLLMKVTDEGAPVSERLRDGIETFSTGSLVFLVGDDGFVSIDQVVEIIKQLLASLSKVLTQFAVNVPNFVIMLIIYLYSLYFFLLDGRSLVRKVSSTIPLREEVKQEFGKTFLCVSRATLKGSFVIGGIQGIVGGMLFWILGLPAPFVFGVLFALTAAIPNFGVIIIWLPTSIILFVAGETGKAILMLIIGGGVLGNVDDMLRPLIIRGDTQLHPVLALSGMIGGLALFGLPGLLLGPIIMSLFVAIWKTFRARYRGELSDVAHGKT